MATSWTDTQLDEMRLAGDPLADDVVATLFETHDVKAVNQLMKTLVIDDSGTPEVFPPVMQRYLELTSEIPLIDPHAAAAGQHLFQVFGPEMMLALLTYSLPECYGDRKGVQVLYRTGYLANRANQRVFQTAQMVMDTMTLGGLGKQGKGVRSAQKVRLMHGAIRWMLLNDPQTPWDVTLGHPINQEDLAFTLMTFSHIVLDGLDKLGITVHPDEQQGFMEAWKLIGRIMGIQEQLIPDDVSAGKTLFETIQKRQEHPCPEGAAMTRALIDMLSTFEIPAEALMRHFLAPELADGFAIAKHPLEAWLIDSASHYRHELDPIQGPIDRRFLLIRKLAMKVIQALVTHELGGQRTPFVIPTNLTEEWNHHMHIWQDPPQANSA